VTGLRGRVRRLRGPVMRPRERMDRLSRPVARPRKRVTRRRRRVTRRRCDFSRLRPRLIYIGRESHPIPLPAYRERGQGVAFSFFGVCARS
jgi:hypothetical protein